MANPEQKYSKADIEKERLATMMLHKEFLAKIQEQLNESVDEAISIKKKFDGSEAWHKEWEERFGKVTADVYFAKKAVVFEKLCKLQNKIFDILVSEDVWRAQKAEEVWGEVEWEAMIDVCRDMDLKRDENGKIKLPEEYVPDEWGRL